MNSHNNSLRCIILTPFYRRQNRSSASLRLESGRINISRQVLLINAKTALLSPVLSGEERKFYKLPKDGAYMKLFSILFLTKLASYQKKKKTKSHKYKLFLLRNNIYVLILINRSLKIGSF